jgi:photosystem II stability/assembly factor-like uncharacterized protein
VQGRLFRSVDGGKHWEHVTNGFPPYTTTNINTGTITFDCNGIAWAIVKENLYRSKDLGKTWDTVWKAPNELTQLSIRRAIPQS